MRRNRVPRRSANLARLGGLLLIFALMLPLLTAPSAGTARAQDGKVLRVHQGIFPDTMDPQVSTTLAEIGVVSMVYEGLTRLDQNLRPVPGAAESWTTSPDGTTLTFTLRQGLTYSDGSPVTAENFRYAIERACDPAVAAPYQSILFDITGCAEFANLVAEEGATPVADADLTAAREALGVRAVDDVTLELTLNQAAPYFPLVAGLWVVYPVKPEMVAKGADWWRDPANHVGNGPYTLTGIEDTLITFGANDRYWGGRPKLDGMEYVIVEETATALEAYKAGDLDVMGPDPSQLPAIRQDPALAEELVEWTGGNTWFVVFNQTQEPFQDKKVREAFAYAFDRQTFCETIRNGDCTPTQSWIPEGVLGAITSETYAFDPEKAKQALAESTYGGPEGLPAIEYYFNSDDPANTARAEWVAGQYLTILGVELTLVPTEGSALSEMRGENASYPQMSIYNWYQDYPDPQNWLSIYWKCDTSYAQNIGYCNEELDTVLDQADAELDEATRRQLYEQGGQLLVADAPVVFLFNVKNQVLIKPDVTGYQLTAADAGWPGDKASALTIDVAR